MKELKKSLQEVKSKIKKEGNLKSLQDERVRLEREILSKALNNIFK